MQTTISINDLDTYLVGGAVRDKLLNREVTEQDFLVIGATAAQMLSLGFTPVGKDFPVFLHPKTKDEYALARTERKQGQGYTGFVCYAEPDVTIEQDLLRRDLTVNAMAQDKDGNIIDPYNGQQDLSDRILRHVSDAFEEDPLRVLRVARFAARYYQYGFSIASETLELMSKISNSGELATISAERIWKEMQRSLTEPNPEVFFEVLRQCQALEKIWPSLDALWDVPNPAKWHPEICTGVHTMMVLKSAVEKSGATTIRFAALCHDLGKGLTPQERLPSHPGHEKAGLDLVEQICNQLKVPNQYKSLALKACEYHLHCHKAFELKATTILRMFNQLDVWRKVDEFEDFLVVCHADFNGRLGNEKAPYPQREFLSEISGACRKIQARPFVEQGFKGKDIKLQIEQARLAKIVELKEELEDRK
ncbi:multifunctional CCA addition/repair protein [Thalassotalea atypica]|uniref:multifunctional CCA addition/repair protein n=1 Tax=Thalassotalea atypica TaxID=2054316 RepID=UPI00257303F0|nr:multifunctional CCA addition/repair protein [Thalassotalea atypica]